MVQIAGISGRGRNELAQVLSTVGRFTTPTDVVDILGVDAETAAKKLARWAEDGWVRRVRRGLYIGVPVDVPNPTTWSEDALVVADAVWSPCYFTGWTAANFWALSEQVFRTTVLKTTSRVHNSDAHLLDHDYLVSHVPNEALTWGMKSEWRGETRLRFANPSRTVVDVLDAPKLGGGIRHTAEIVAAYLDEHDPGLLIEYGERLGNRAIFKRLGYIVETLALDAPGIVDACRDRMSTGISMLDPDGPDRGRRVMRWRLQVNVRLGKEGPS
jgi:predicted transcriptional regulator of viral defense system